MEGLSSMSRGCRERRGELGFWREDRAHGWDHRCVAVKGEMRMWGEREREI